MKNKFVLLLLYFVLFAVAGKAQTIGHITGGTSVCEGSTITVSDATPGGTWSLNPAWIATISASGVITGIAAGTGIISYVVGVDTASIPVIVENLTGAWGITGASVVCVGAVITLLDTTIGGIWRSSSSTATVVPITIGSCAVSGIAIGTDSIFYSVSNSCGTADTFVVLTIATSTVTAGAITGSALVCPMTAITLTDPTGTAGGTWSSSSAAIASVSPSSGIAEGISGGTVNISYVVSTSCGLFSTYVPLTVYPFPVVGAISATTNELCIGSVITITDIVGGGVWSASNPLVGTVLGGIVTGVSPGTDTIFYSASMPCGIAYTYFVVTVEPYTGIITGSTVVCTGGAITLSDAVSFGVWSTGNSNATVTSSGIVTGVSAGTDSIFYTITDTCGTSDASFVVNINDAISPTVVLSDSTLTATPGYTTYQWYYDSVLIPGATSTSLYVTDTGNYFVLVTSPGGCFTASNIIGVYNLEVGTVYNQGAISIYPNPAQNKMVITAKLPIQKIAILNLIGQTVFSESYDNRQVTISLANLPAGVYLMKVNDTQVYKVVKE